MQAVILERVRVEVTPRVLGDYEVYHVEITVTLLGGRIHVLDKYVPRNDMVALLDVTLDQAVATMKAELHQQVKDDEARQQEQSTS